MLADRGQFALAERALRDQGKIDDFEKENGLIKERMMIREVPIPEGIEITEIEGKTPIAF